MAQHYRMRAHYRHLNCWATDWQPGDVLGNRSAKTVFDHEFCTPQAAHKRQKQDPEPTADTPA
eukprot:9259403-Prorocentrum_lima.AAC.1